MSCMVKRLKMVVKAVKSVVSVVEVITLKALVGISMDVPIIAVEKPRWMMMMNCQKHITYISNVLYLGMIYGLV